MNIVFVLIPLSLILVALAGWAFFWSVDHAQFDDLDTPALIPLADDVPVAQLSRTDTDAGTPLTTEALSQSRTLIRRFAPPSPDGRRRNTPLPAHDPGPAPSHVGIGALPSHADALPSHAGALPSHADALPSHADALPSHAGALPSHVAALPSHADALPSHAGALPSHAGALPSHVAQEDESSPPLPPGEVGARSAPGEGSGSEHRDTGWTQP